MPRLQRNTLSPAPERVRPPSVLERNLRRIESTRSADYRQALYRQMSDFFSRPAQRVALSAGR